MSFHALSTGDSNHAITARTYTDIAARDADTVWQVTANIDKVVKVTDTDTYFVLVSVGASVWKEVTHADQDLSTTATPTFAGIQFPISGSLPSHSEGLLHYDYVEKTLSFYNAEAEITMNLGEEQWVRVRNSSGGTITDGQAVYILGAVSDNPTIALAKADDIDTSAVVGLATHDIENNTVGYVTVSGVVHGLVTNSFAAGDTVYLSATTAGEFTNTPPSGNNFDVIIGTVTRAHVSDGSVLVHPQQIVPLTAGVFAHLSMLDQALKTTDDVAFGSYSVSALNTAPASATATGTTGEIRWTATHVYLCTATDVWVRAALTTW